MSKLTLQEFIDELALDSAYNSSIVKDWCDAHLHTPPEFFTLELTKDYVGTVDIIFTCPSDDCAVEIGYRTLATQFHMCGTVEHICETVVKQV